MSPVATVKAAEAMKVESPSSVPRATPWASLPVEVRQMIFSLVSSPISEERYRGLRSSKMARFATVCREWQVFFETCIFRRLVLGPNTLDNFDTIIRRNDTRLGYIRKLWLRIQLPKYGCLDCDQAEDEATQDWCVGHPYTTLRYRCTFSANI